MFILPGSGPEQSLETFKVSQNNAKPHRTPEQRRHVLWSYTPPLGNLTYGFEMALGRRVVHLTFIRCDVWWRGNHGVGCFHELGLIPHF